MATGDERRRHARERLEALVVDVPDFPEAGVVFKDITPVLSDADGLRAIVDGLATAADGSPVDVVVGLEARGFILGPAVALALGCGFAPARKAGKLPRERLSRSYALEYGEAVLELHRDAVTPGARVLVVDDVLATGGTARAACELVREAGGDLVGVAVLMELAFLDGRAALPGVAVTSLTSVG